MPDELSGGIDSWEWKAWKVRLGSMPIERVLHDDQSQDYEIVEAHVYKLKNGKYALITEEGCSCYSSDDASIDLFPTLEAAKEAFNKWQRERREPC